MDQQILAVILAAGEGKRMHSNLPKVLHRVAGIPMVRRVMAAVDEVITQPPVVVVGAGREAVMAELQGDAVFAVQEQQLGTGHAVLCAKEACKDADVLLVLAGDMPLMTRAAVKELVEGCQGGALASMLTTVVDNPTGYGRILRNQQGLVQGIVEEKDATEQQKKICEVNASAYCFAAKPLFEALSHLTCENAQGEYYLTDCIRELASLPGGVVAIHADEQDCMGVNDPQALAQADEIAHRREERR